MLVISPLAEILDMLELDNCQRYTPGAAAAATATAAAAGAAATDAVVDVTKSVGTQAAEAE